MCTHRECNAFLEPTEKKEKRAFIYIPMEYSSTACFTWLGPEEQETKQSESFLMFTEVKMIFIVFWGPLSRLKVILVLLLSRNYKTIRMPYFFFHLFIHLLINLLHIRHHAFMCNFCNAQRCWDKRQLGPESNLCSAHQAALHT